MRSVVVPVTAFQQNCSVLVCEETRRAAVVDPGGDLDHIVAAIEREGATLEKILLTHGHLDHCGGTHALAAQFKVPIEGPHPDESFWLDQLAGQARMFGFPPSENFVPDRWLQDGDNVQFGNVTLGVRHCPGHTPGHIIFFSETERLAWVGDVLFAGSIGRTDFPRGNHAQLLTSIRDKLWPLGDDMTFVPGHGPTSTFGEERATNPYVADQTAGRS